MKIAVIGSKGQLGEELAMVLHPHTVVGFTHDDIEVTNEESVREALHTQNFDVIINTVAVTNTEQCEENASRAIAINAIGACNVAEIAAENETAILYVSTDYVFDGEKEYFTENDCPHPLNVYGASKLLGEMLTRIRNKKHWIVRTSWLYGTKNGIEEHHNFVSIIKDKAKKGNALKVINDQFGCPTFTYDLAQAIKEMIENKTPYGIYHIVNQGSCSWFEFAEEILKSHRGKTEIAPIHSEEGTSKITRPTNSILRSTRLANTNIKPLRKWQDALVEFLGK